MSDKKAVSKRMITNTRHEYSVSVTSRLGLPLIARVSFFAVFILAAIFSFSTPAAAHDRHGANPEFMQNSVTMDKGQETPSDILPSCCHFGLSSSSCGPGACIFDNLKFPNRLYWQQALFLPSGNSLNRNLTSTPPTPPPIFS
jgi:hypothetical protein